MTRDTPLFPNPLHVGRPNLPDRQAFIEKVHEIFDRNWLSNDGPFVIEFERRLAEIVGVKHVVAMCNATVALEIAIRAAGISGEVILPSFTFVATAHALSWQRIMPVFCEINPGTHTIDPQRIEELITPRTSAIIGVHTWGNPCEIAALTEIAARRGLTLMFDAAHAFGCSHKGQMIGRFGRAEVFSFHATKFIPCGEGGAVATNDDELADAMRLMRNFGFQGYDRVIHPGTNGKMGELSAAFGLCSLEQMPTIIEHNKANYEHYRRAFADVPGLSVIAYDDVEHNNYQYVVCEVCDVKCPLTRDELIRILHSHNVLARRYFYPGVHRMEPYASLLPAASRVLPVTEDVANRVLVLPTGLAVGSAEIDAIAAILKAATTVPSAAGPAVLL
jgi:dTDP-4-amino-4,6-dideoxygalactose transaminase